MHKYTMAISPGYDLLHVSATIYSARVVAMLSSGLITFTNMSLYSPGWWPCLSLFTWMVAMSLIIHLDGGHVSLYSPGWWPCPFITKTMVMSFYSPGWWPCLFIHLDGGHVSLFIWMVVMSLFIHLDGGHVSLKPDDLPDQFSIADADQFVHGGPGHVFGRHHRAGHRVHVTKLSTTQKRIM